MRAACAQRLHLPGVVRAAALRQHAPTHWGVPPAAVAAAAAPQRLRHVARAAAAAAYGGSPSSSYGSLASSESDGGLPDFCAGSSTGWLLDGDGAPRGWADSPADSASSASTATSPGSSLASSDGASYDAIMMLGGGLLPGGGLPEWVVRRLEGCLHLYRAQPCNAAAARAAQDGLLLEAAPAQAWAPPPRPGCPIVLLGAGTPHKPAVVDEAGFVLHESTAYAAYLMRRGVPAADLLKEAQSYDTVGNGYFSLLMHALPAGWRRIAVVTSEFHMPRTRATFDFIYGLAGAQLHGDPGWYSLDYRPVSDAGIFDADVLEARREKEAAAVAAWRRNTSGMRSLADLHAWLYATHLCYSVSRQHEFGRERDLDPKLAATY